MANERRATRRLTAIAGLSVVVMFGAGSALWAFEQPDPGTPPTEIAAFYADNSGEIVAGASLSLVAIAVFGLFASGVRAILREHEGDDLLATTAFAGALVVMAAGLGAETINMAGALRAERRAADTRARPGAVRDLLRPWLQRRRGGHRSLLACDRGRRAARAGADAAMGRARSPRRRVRIPHAAVSVPARALAFTDRRGIGAAIEDVRAGR